MVPIVAPGLVKSSPAVAMDYALGVCCFEGIGNLNRQVQHFLEWKWLTRNAVLQGFAVETSSQQIFL
jgi:hypothetical protein